VRARSALSLTIVGAVACTAPPPRTTSFDIGLGPTVRLAVAGASSLEPAVTARNGEVVVSWIANRDGRTASYEAKSVDAGAAFSTPRQVSGADLRSRELPASPFTEHLTKDQVVAAIGLAEPGDVQATLDASKTVVAVWTEQADGAPARVMLRRLIPAQHGIAAALPATELASEPLARHPVVAAVSGGVVVAWTSGADDRSVVEVRRVGLDSICVDATASDHGAHR